ncbi:hypothetical protein GCM10023201_23480 [Actinomycetospora corticicola]|uniref:DoxX family membrane protein n=1 Tax=Actinomycetospora corticicola TaxID=663602 RepID=A0A7Y9DRN1_9PSEU|nr:hypothetical protein [Actinomycetospora corticicola]NYD33932.1 hypothetical protein [Actinomycetospora corticicola]
MTSAVANTLTNATTGATTGLRDRAWVIPLRLVSGGYVLDSGLSKWGADEATAKYLHGFARGAYPFLEQVDPITFARGLAAGEVGLGAALLLPVVPNAVVGVGLLAFGAGLLGLYAATPGMRRPGSVFPTPDGIPLAKDVWLVGIGAALALAGNGSGRRRRRSRLAPLRLAS